MSTYPYWQDLDLPAKLWLVTFEVAEARLPTEYVEAIRAAAELLDTMRLGIHPAQQLSRRHPAAR